MIFSVGEQNSNLKMVGVFMVDVKLREVVMGGELQRMTKERTTMIVTVAVLGTTKRSSGR